MSKRQQDEENERREVKRPEKSEEGEMSMVQSNLCESKKQSEKAENYVMMLLNSLAWWDGWRVSIDRNSGREKQRVKETVCTLFFFLPAPCAHDRVTRRYPVSWETKG